MTEPHPEPPIARVPVEVDAKAIRSESIRAVRVILRRAEMDSNTVERSIRPLALTRKNALFAGSDRGGQT